MARIEVVVCDVCRELGRPTRTYELRRDDEDPVLKELCARHGAPFDALLDGVTPTKRAATPTPATETPPRRRRRTTPIVTLEQIEEIGRAHV